MRIQNNIMAMNTHRMYTTNNSNIQKSAEKLSSGYRINRAGDDAAGLAISEKMRSQIRGLGMASKNSQDAISLVQTAEGALQEVHSMLQRMNELAVQAATGTNQEFDRLQLAKEFSQLKREINDIAEQTTFNNMKILDGSLSHEGPQRSAQTAGLLVSNSAVVSATSGAIQVGTANAAVAPTTAGTKAKIDIALGTIADDGTGTSLENIKVGDTVLSFAAPIAITGGDGAAAIATAIDSQTVTDADGNTYTITDNGGGSISIEANANGKLNLDPAKNTVAFNDGKTNNINAGALGNVTVADGTDDVGGAAASTELTVDVAKIKSGDKLDIGSYGSITFADSDLPITMDTLKAKIEALDTNGNLKASVSGSKIVLTDATVTAGNKIDATYTAASGSAAAGAIGATPTLTDGGTAVSAVGATSGAVEGSAPNAKIPASFTLSFTGAAKGGSSDFTDFKIGGVSVTFAGGGTYDTTGTEPNDIAAAFAGATVELSSGQIFTASVTGDQVTFTQTSGAAFDVTASNALDVSGVTHGAGTATGVPTAGSDPVTEVAEGATNPGTAASIDYAFDYSKVQVGDTIDVGGAEYTVVAESATPGANEIKIGANAAGFASNLTALSEFSGYTVSSTSSDTKLTIEKDAVGVSASTAIPTLSHTANSGSAASAKYDFDYSKLAAGDKVTVGTTEYTVVANDATPGAGEVKIGANAADFASNLTGLAELNGTYTVTAAADGKSLTITKDTVDADLGSSIPALSHAAGAATPGTPAPGAAYDGDTSYITFDRNKMRTGDTFTLDGTNVATWQEGMELTDFVSQLGLTQGTGADQYTLKDNTLTVNKAITQSEIDSGFTPVPLTSPDANPYGTMRIQVGALEYEQLNIEVKSMNTKGLGLDDFDLNTQDRAGSAITATRAAIDLVSDQRSLLGAMQNRLEHKISNLDNTAENLQAAESRIRDVDIAKEMTTFTKNNILAQAATAMLAQANAAPQSVLSLLQ